MIPSKFVIWLAGGSLMLLGTDLEKVSETVSQACLLRLASQRLEVASPQNLDLMSATQELLIVQSIGARVCRSQTSYEEVFQPEAKLCSANRHATIRLLTTLRN